MIRRGFLSLLGLAPALAFAKETLQPPLPPARPGGLSPDPLRQEPPTPTGMSLLATYQIPHIPPGEIQYGWIIFLRNGKKVYAYPLSLAQSSPPSVVLQAFFEGNAKESDFSVERTGIAIEGVLEWSVAPRIKA